MVKTEIKTSDGTTTKRVKREATDDVDEEDCEEKNEEVAKITPMKNNEGDSFFELSGKRRCTVRKWNNNILIDIREVGIIKPKIIIDRFESSFSTSFNASYVYSSEMVRHTKRTERLFQEKRAFLSLLINIKR
jgi:hypothetical protein